MDKDECMVLRKTSGVGYAIVMLHKTTVRPTTYGLVGTKEKVSSMVKNPIITENKNKTPMFKIGLISEDSLQSTCPIVKITRLVIDYDNERKDKNLIEKFVKQFKEYSFILYTTFSSKSNVPKFRVILKLKTPVDYRIFNERVCTELVDKFSIGKNKPDYSCFLPTQFQYLPCKRKEGYYKYIINKGKLFELYDKDVFDKYSKPDMVDMMISYNMKIGTFKIDNDRDAELIKLLNTLRAGVRRSYINEVALNNRRSSKKSLLKTIAKSKYKHRFNFVFNIAPLYYRGFITEEDICRLCEKTTGKPMTAKHFSKLKGCVRALVNDDKLKEGE